ncbi:MAG TPA: maleylpyruvate isomerase N-terminal domain-containing protein [Longimicrobiaceae bacterium]
MEPLLPIDTAGLLPPLHDALVSLLRGLAPDDWERPTVAGAWRVRDVAAHLLDGDLRTLSAYRDGHSPPPPEPIRGYGDLVRFLDGLNAGWVAAAERLSPRVLTGLLEWSGPGAAAALASRAPDSEAVYPVAWAGEERSEHWMDVGRHYTERWHHQMQVRDAVGAPLLLGDPWLRPLLELSVRALPHAYASVPAPDGAALVLRVTGEEGAGGAWSLARERGAWRLLGGAAPEPTTVVRLDADAAWRLFYNALPAGAARERAVVTGDAELAEPLFATRSVMV